MLLDEDLETDAVFSSRKEIMAEPTIRETGFVGAFDDVCGTRINDLFRQSAFVLSFSFDDNVRRQNFSEYLLVLWCFNVWEA